MASTEASIIVLKKMFQEFAFMGLVLSEFGTDADDGRHGPRHSGAQKAMP